MSQSQDVKVRSGIGLGMKIFLGFILGAFTCVGGTCLTCGGLAAVGGAAAKKAKEERLAQVQSEQAATPALQVSARELGRAYERNEVAADQIYKGVRMEVTGTIQALGKGLGDDIYVSLDSGLPLRDVRCSFNDEEGAAVAQLTKGQKVTLSGTGAGLMMSVQLRNCSVVGPAVAGDSVK